ncbi:MAG TPA: antitoxin family protein [Lacipirellulaceae bacterium]
MIHNIEAIYDHGVFRPIQPLALPEGARVHLSIEEADGAQQQEAKPEGEPTTLLERMKDVVGVIDDLPEDSSTNLDHYLYRRPKR